MTTVGFVGLGNMGKGMSINLLNNDINVIGYDINTESYKNIQNKNFTIANDIKSLTEKVNLLLRCYLMECS